MTPTQKVLHQFIVVIKIQRIKEMKNAAIRAQDFEKAVKYREQEAKEERNLLTFEELEQLQKELE